MHGILSGIRRSTLILTAGFLLTAGALAAEFDGYLVRLDTGPRLFAAAPLPELEEVYAPGGLFHADSLEDVRTLAEAGVLVYAEPDYIVLLDDGPFLSADTSGTAGNWAEPWYFEDLDMDYSRTLGVTGEGVRVGVIDSGLYTEHDALSGVRIVPGRDYTADGSPDTSDDIGHGTFVSGLIAAAPGLADGVAGLAPAVELVPLKCFNNRGDDTSGKISFIARAIFEAVDSYHCQILNMSFGLSAPSTPLREAVEYADRAGVIMVAAVGNLRTRSTGNDPLLYPAAWPEVIGVGSVGPSLTVSSFSCQNASVWVSAPGGSLTGLSTSGGYNVGSGTSYAAPVVTAAVALVLSMRPDISGGEAADLLRHTAWDLGPSGFDNAYGHGLLDVGMFLATVRGDLSYQLMETVNRLENEDALLLLASYDAQGRMLSIQEIDKSEIPKQDSGTLWKLFVLDPVGFLPLQSPVSLDISGGGIYNNPAF